MFNDKKKEASKTTSESNPVFSASDMQSRWEKLKAAKKVPPLQDVLKVVRKV